MSKIKIGWILSVDRNTASSRLQGYLIHEWLVQQGVDSHIVANKSCELKGLHDYKFYRIIKKIYSENYTHIVFEGPEWAVFQISVLCKLLGKITICVRCDNLKADYDAYFDATILPTKRLADSLGITKRNIIPDCVEVMPSQFKSDYSQKSAKIKVVWVGHQGYKIYLLDLIARLKINPFVNEFVDFVLISKGDFATIEWSLNTVFSDVMNCDAALIPIPEGEWYIGKSSNRLAMMMALGMPVVATAIPSYEDIAVDSRDVLFVHNEEEIVDCLRVLSSENTRRFLGHSARSSLGDRFSIDAIAFLWLQTIRDTIDSKDQMPRRSLRARILAILLRLVSAISRKARD